MKPLGSFARENVSNLIPLLEAQGFSGNGSVAAADITDATAVGRALLTAADEDAAKAALGLTLENATETIGIEVFTGAEAVVVGDGARVITIPQSLNGWNLIRVEAAHITAGAGGTATTIQINNTADMLSTALTIDSGEANSGTAATAAVINTAADDVLTFDQIRIDIDTADTTTAPLGLHVILTFQEP